MIDERDYLNIPVHESTTEWMIADKCFIPSAYESDQSLSEW